MEEEERGKTTGNAFKRAILGLFTLALALLLATFAVSIWVMQQRELDHDLTQLRHAVDASYHGAIDQQAQMLAATLSAIIADPRYVAPFQAGDRAALLALARPLYERLKQAHEITHFYFIRPDHVTVLRVHIPKNFGDRIDRLTLRQAEERQALAQGIELGMTGTFTLRTVVPWMHEGKLIGYIELGKELEPVAAQVAGTLGTGLAVVIDKSRLERAHWEEGMRLLGRPANWEQFPRDVLVGGSERTLPAGVAERLTDWRTATPDGLDRTSTEGRELALTFLPLADAGGAKMGAILLMVDISTRVTEMWHALATVSAVGLGVGLILLLLFHLILSRVEHRLAAAEAERLRSTQYRGMLHNVTAVIDSMGDGLLATDSRGIIAQANPALLDMFGLAAAPVGLACHEVFAADIVGFITEALDRAGSQAVLTSEVVLPGRRVAKVMATLLHAEDEQAGEAAQGAVFTFRDITREVEISRMKTDFIANVSHELRTPLTSVLGFAKLIRKQFRQTVQPALDQADEKLARTAAKIEANLEIIVTEGERLTKLINDVLDITKIEAGKIEWRAEPMAIGPLIERAFGSTNALFQHKALLQELDVAAGLPEVVGDPDRILQVIINLLSNAAKFTEHGHVRCSARLSGGEIVVSVTDTGRGITPADQKQLFERFRQVGDTLTDKPAGTGLGLAICKQIVEHHHGRIWLESAPGSGSTFSFSLPVSVAGMPAAAPLPVAAAAVAETGGGRFAVLVVDDEPSIRELLRQELEAAGYAVREASNGMEAIRLAKAEPPDLILLDIMMPGMNGFEVAAVLRAAPETSIIPLIILSIVDDRPRGLAVGADRYLSKPVNVDELLEAIDTLIHQRETHKRVLVVDEDESAIASLRDVLLAKGYKVEVAAQGTDSKQRIREYTPGLVVISGSADQSAQVISSMRMARGDERILLLTTSAPRESESGDA